MSQKYLWWPLNYATAHQILAAHGISLPRKTALEGLPIFVAHSEEEARELYKKSLGGVNPVNGGGVVAIVSNTAVSAERNPGRFGSIRITRKAYQWAATEPIGPLREGTGWVL